MEVKIGIQNATRELLIETGQTQDEVEAAVIAALSGKTGVLSLSDDKGRRVIIPVVGLAYIELGEAEVRHVGFASSRAAK